MLNWSWQLSDTCSSWADSIFNSCTAVREVIVLEKKSKGAGKSGSIAHVGFRLQRPKDIDAAARAVKKAGGIVKDKGEFVPGEPYVFATDPDGYEIEIWYERPTPVDPPPGGRQARVR